MQDVFCLAVGEGCIVWVYGEKSLASDDLSVFFVGVEVAGMGEVLDKDVCLLFV